MSGPPDDYMDDTTHAGADPSPVISAHLTRLQAESLERHLTAQGTKRWAPLLKELRRALDYNANGKRYPWQKEET